MNVTLIVGSNGTTTNGLTTSPTALTFSQRVVGQSVGSQTATVYYNGAATNVTNVSFTPLSGPTGAITFASCFPSGATIQCNLTCIPPLAQGTHMGTATVVTSTGGTIGVPVTTSQHQHGRHFWSFREPKILRYLTRSWRVRR